MRLFTGKLYQTYNIFITTDVITFYQRAWLITKIFLLIPPEGQLCDRRPFSTLRECGAGGRFQDRGWREAAGTMALGSHWLSAAGEGPELPTKAGPAEPGVGQAHAVGGGLAQCRSGGDFRGLGRRDFYPLTKVRTRGSNAAVPLPRTPTPQAVQSALRSKRHSFPP